MAARTAGSQADCAMAAAAAAVVAVPGAAPPAGRVSGGGGGRGCGRWSPARGAGAATATVVVWWREGECATSETLPAGTHDRRRSGWRWAVQEGGDSGEVGARARLEREERTRTGLCVRRRSLLFGEGGDARVKKRRARGPAPVRPHSVDGCLQ